MENLRREISRYFVGKEDITEDVLTCFLAGGHVLLEDVPGVGKTTLAKTVAGVFGLDFGRIQFTPDTLPGDIIGNVIYDMKTGEFRYREGAVMHRILLADEINRTSPKTQASLLEAMGEGQVTVDGKTYALPKPFFVIATQNPVEFMGTYPLPEAQVDRFMMKLSIGYPDASESLRMAKNHLSEEKDVPIECVCSPEKLLQMQEEVKRVHVSDALLQYMEEIVRLTRTESRLLLGASPRAYLQLIDASRARAYLQGRDFVKPDDVRAVAVNVLHHRLQLTPEAKVQREDMSRILKMLVTQAKVPMER